jgi:hypothetical protein
MAVYDPEFNIKQMISDGQVYTAQIDANSHTVLNIGLVHYRYINKISNYRYRMWSGFDPEIFANAPL